MPLTDEQEAIIAAGASGKSVRVAAFAGTGKTTTLTAAAEALKSRRVRYVVFNRAQKTAAIERFKHLPHVKVGTAHGMAYGAFGRAHYNGRIDNSESIVMLGWRDYMVQKNALRPIQPDHRARASRMVIETLRRFMASSAPRIDATMVPDDPNFDAEYLAHIANRLWATIEQVDALKVTHDVYLKSWQLRNPVIPGVDTVLYDEAQDTTPSMLAIMERQRGLQRIYVGDPHQQIYEFRGAVNALSSLDLPLLPLTRSWRFGPEIAAAANAILVAKGERLRVRPGAPKPDRTALGYPTTKPDVVLARTNVGLIERALVLIEQGRRVFIRGATNETTGVAGDGAGELMGKILDAFRLWEGGRPRSAAFDMFESWNELKETSEEDGGESYRPFVKLVEEHGKGVTRIVALIRDNTSKSEAEADVTLSTVHRFKGEERPIVVLANDFRSFSYTQRATESKIFDEGEANIAYVAVTRAQKDLWMGGAYTAIAESVSHAGGGTFPITRIEAPKASARVGYVIMTGVSTTVPSKPAAPPPQSFGEYTPGSRFQHSIYGPLTVESANAQTISVRLDSGETKHLATIASKNKLRAIAK